MSVTLGPRGRNVIIESPFGAPKITKDGVTVAKAIEFEGPTKNLGAALVRQVSPSSYINLRFRRTLLLSLARLKASTHVHTSHYLYTTSHLAVTVTGGF